MDAFLLAMILSFAIAFGGRDQMIVAQFAQGFGRSAPLFATAALCATLSAGVMAYAGAHIAALLPARAAQMLVAFALAAAAVELFWPVRLKEMKEPTRSFVAIGAVVFARQLGDAARFAIFGIAAWAVYPTTAFGGGALGGIAAVWLGWSLGLARLETLPLRAVRIGIGLCMIVAALVIGLNARFTLL